VKCRQREGRSYYWRDDTEGEFLTLQLGLFTDQQMDAIDGVVCGSPRESVGTVRGLPWLAVLRPEKNIGLNYPSIKAHAAQLTITH